MVQRWDPFRDLLTIQEQMSRLFEGSVGRHQHASGIAGWHPPADVSETEDSLHLYIEVPGVDENEVDIRVEGDILTIRGERQRPNPSSGTFLQTEILMGPFHRVFKLPAVVDTSNIQARYERGILEIILPKQEVSVSKSVKIQSG